MERQKATDGGNGFAAVCRLLSLAVATVYRYLPLRFNVAKRFSTPFNISPSTLPNASQCHDQDERKRAAKKVKSSHDTYPAENRRSGHTKSGAIIAARKSVVCSKYRRGKRRKVALVK